MKISAERGTCKGYGNCLIAAPKVFDLDDQGLVVLLDDTVDGRREIEAVERAAYDCPTDSIVLTEADVAG
jgi:ferredoxin